MMTAAMMGSSRFARAERADEDPREFALILRLCYGIDWRDEGMAGRPHGVYYHGLLRFQ
jgi:hypothetical protein